MTGRHLVATDLDRTLIYSRTAVAALPPRSAELRAVEVHDGEDASWMTAAAAAAFSQLHRRAVVVPVTTRTPEQWRRVRLPGPQPRWAVTANGGILIQDGQVDAAWERAVVTALRGSAPLPEVWEQAGRICRPEWTTSLRNAHDLFCYAVIRRSRLPDGFLAETAAWAGSRGWQVSLQGRKLYWVPRSLTKSAAVAEIARRTDAGLLLAAGDSLLDADLLEAAHAGVLARHGELAASGWHAPHVEVTAASGVLAGEEIVRWFAARTGPGND